MVWEGFRVQVGLSRPVEYRPSSRNQLVKECVGIETAYRNLSPTRPYPVYSIPISPYLLTSLSILHPPFIRVHPANKR